MVGLSRATHRTVILQTKELRASSGLQGTLFADNTMFIDEDPLATYKNDDLFQAEIAEVNIVKHAVTLVTRNKYTSIKVSEWYDNRMKGINVYLEEKDSYKIPTYRGLKSNFSGRHVQLPEHIGQIILIGDSQADIANKVIASSFAGIVSA